jgi:hypothetical protein
MYVRLVDWLVGWLVGLICNNYVTMHEVKNVKPYLFLSPPVEVSG